MIGGRQFQGNSGVKPVSCDAAGDDALKHVGEPGEWLDGIEPIFDTCPLSN